MKKPLTPHNAISPTEFLPHQVTLQSPTPHNAPSPKSQIITFALFAIGMILYAFGINGSLRTQTFFLLGGVVLIITHFRLISLDSFRAIKIPIFTFLGLVFISLLLVFDTVMPLSFSQVLKEINSHIFKYFLLFLLSYIFAFYIARKYALGFFYVFVYMCAVNVVATIFVWIRNDFSSWSRDFGYNEPFFFQSIFTYNIWLLYPSAFALAGFCIARSWAKKAIFLVLIAICLIAIIANSERSFLVAFMAMICSCFVFWKYPYKRRILAIFGIFLVVFFFVAYEFSKNLPPRYNFAHMVDNFHIVWNTPPREMGKYDEGCFNGWLECKSESTKNGKSEITWEHSSLSRIAMGKSTFLSALDSPFVPHTLSPFNIGSYLYIYYKEAGQNPEKSRARNLQNSTYSLRDGVNLYNSPHNYVVSLFFMFGILGFGLVVMMYIFMFVSAKRALNKSLGLDSPEHSTKMLDSTKVLDSAKNVESPENVESSKNPPKNLPKQNLIEQDSTTTFIALSFLIFLCGLATQSVFDAIYPIILEPIFIMFGFVMGFLLKTQIPRNLGISQNLASLENPHNPTVSHSPNLTNPHKSPKRILLTIGDISITGGAERVVVNLANLFAESGHSVEILSFYRSNKTLPYSLKNVKLSFYCDIGESDFSAKWTQNVLKKFYFKNLYKPLLSFHIKKRYKDIDFFIISDWVYTPIFRHKVAKYIKLIHLNFTRYHKRNNYFDMLVILSKKELETWQKYHKNIAVIPNFLTPFSPIDSQKSRQKIVLSIGRMDDNQKGFLRLIDIWAILAQDSSFKAEFSKWQLHIVGDGILKNELWKKIKAANLGDSIVLKPFTKNIQNEYAKSSIYALTSHYEGFGMVLLESGYFGLPSVAFDVKTGPSDIIENEKSGFLVSDNDLNAFADSLKMLMSDEKMRENFGKNAKQIVQEKFSKEAIRGLWENLLQQ